MAPPIAVGHKTFRCQSRSRFASIGLALSLEPRVSSSASQQHVCCRVRIRESNMRSHTLCLCARQTVVDVSWPGRSVSVLSIVVDTRLQCHAP